VRLEWLVVQLKTRFREVKELRRSAIAQQVETRRLGEESERMERERSRLEADLGSARELLSTRNTQTADLREEVATLKGQLQVAVLNVEVNEANASRDQEATSTLQRELERAYSDLERVRRDGEALRDKLISETGASAIAAHAHAEASHQASVMVAELEEEVSTLTRRLGDVEAAAARDVEVGLAELKTQLMVANARCDTALRENGNTEALLQSTKETLRKESERLQTELATAQESLVDATRRLTAGDIARGELERALEAARDEGHELDKQANFAATELEAWKSADEEMKADLLASETERKRLEGIVSQLAVAKTDQERHVRDLEEIRVHSDRALKTLTEASTALQSRMETQSSLYGSEDKSTKRDAAVLSGSSISGVASNASAGISGEAATAIASMHAALEMAHRGMVSAAAEVEHWRTEAAEATTQCALSHAALSDLETAANKASKMHAHERAIATAAVNAHLQETNSLRADLRKVFIIISTSMRFLLYSCGSSYCPQSHLNRTILTVVPRDSYLIRLRTSLPPHVPRQRNYESPCSSTQSMRQ
jgi:chromosome segregation ATPase